MAGNEFVLFLESCEDVRTASLYLEGGGKVVSGIIGGLSEEVIRFDGTEFNSYPLLACLPVTTQRVVLLAFIESMSRLPRAPLLRLCKRYSSVYASRGLSWNSKLLEILLENLLETSSGGTVGSHPAVIAYPWVEDYYTKGSTSTSSKAPSQTPLQAQSLDKSCDSNISLEESLIRPQPCADSSTASSVVLGSDVTGTSVNVDPKFGAKKRVGEDKDKDTEDGNRRKQPRVDSDKQKRVSVRPTVEAHHGMAAELVSRASKLRAQFASPSALKSSQARDRAANGVVALLQAAQLQAEVGGQILIVCRYVGLERASDDVVGVISSRLCTPDLSRRASIPFVRAVFLPKVRLLSSPASRALVGALQAVSKHHPEAVVDGLVLPLLCSNRNGSDLNEGKGEEPPPPAPAGSAPASTGGVSKKPPKPNPKSKPTPKSGRGDGGGVGAVQCELITRLVKTGLPPTVALDIFRGLFLSSSSSSGGGDGGGGSGGDGGSPGNGGGGGGGGGGCGDGVEWNELTVSLMNQLVCLSTPLPDVVVGAIIEAADMAFSSSSTSATPGAPVAVRGGAGTTSGGGGGLAASLKFSTLLFSLVTKYGPQVRPHVHVLRSLLQRCTSFMARSALGRLNQLNK